MAQLTIVVPILNQFNLTETTMLRFGARLQAPLNVQLIIVDNGSAVRYENTLKGSTNLQAVKNGVGEFLFLRNESNKGSYPVIHQALPYVTSPIVVFLHNDVFIHEYNWDTRLLSTFDANPDVGLIGFWGGTAVNASGVMTGQISNMMGTNVQGYAGTSAESVGTRITGFEPNAKMIDAGVMAFRKSTLQQIPQKNIVPHPMHNHFLSLQVQELGQKVGVLGVEFDHVVGQTLTNEPEWPSLAQDWFTWRNGTPSLDAWSTANASWVSNPQNPSFGITPTSWTQLADLENERLFLTEFRDQKGMLPR